MAALLTRTSRRPYRRSRSAATWAMVAGSVTSRRRASTRWWPGRAAAARSALARSRAVRTTGSQGQLPGQFPADAAVGAGDEHDAGHRTPRSGSAVLIICGPLASGQSTQGLTGVCCSARSSPAAAECLEDLVDHECRPEQALDDRQQVLPEPLGLLPEVHQGPEDPQTVDGAAASGRARVAAVAHHPPASRHRRERPGSTVPTPPRCATPATTAAAPGSRRRRAESTGRPTSNELVEQGGPVTWSTISGCAPPPRSLMRIGGLVVGGGAGMAKSAQDRRVYTPS